MDHIGGTASRSREEWNDPRCDGAPPREETLDPEDWNALRTLGHQMLDDMFDSIATVRDRAVWHPRLHALRHKSAAISSVHHRMHQ